ncbi:MAG: universal stress protein [Deltaproteobacteria bacterium]|nr:universal stress protein [Deltaproteobacteria bacterium]MBW2116556.1 universal stress protein [Deltaproteobacteria bacterium]
MFQRILAVFENEEIFDEAITYTRELAIRMDSEVTLLMLVEMAFLDRSFLGSKRNSIMHLEERMGKAMTSLSVQFAREGISVSTALRIGDLAEELLKFLAGKPPFQALIWGSDRDLPESGQFRRGHWVGKVAGNLECPLLTVSNREQPLIHTD